MRTPSSMKMAKSLSYDTIETVVTRKVDFNESPKYLMWALVNVAVLAFFYADVVKWDACSCIFNDPFTRSMGAVVWRYSEMVIIAGLSCSVVANVWHFIRPRLGYPPVYLSPKQKELLGVNDGDPGFDALEQIPVSPRNSPSPNRAHLLTPSSIRSSTPSGSITPINTSASSWMSSSSSYSSWSSFNKSDRHASFYISDGISSGTSSPSSVKSEPPSYTAPRLEFERRMERERQNMRDLSSYDPSDFIASEWELSRFLHRPDDTWVRREMAAASRNLSETFRDSAHVQEVESTPPKRYLYQMAPTTSSAPAAGRKDESSVASSLHAVVFARGKLGISPEKLDLWTEHLRKWISETIVRPVNKEIEAVNDKLKMLGSGDSNRIGTMSLNQVAALAVSGYPGISSSAVDFSSLQTLIPFLEAHPNQEYLVRRISTLSKKGYLGEYRWKEGDSFEGKPWGEHLPSDAMIVLHLFASYFDVHLPLTTFESPRPFSHRHILRRTSGTTGASVAGLGGALSSHLHPSALSTPGGVPTTSSSAQLGQNGPGIIPGQTAAVPGSVEKGLKVQTSVGSVIVPDYMRDSAVICVAETSPPHFVFIHKGEACEAAKGRNNLFHTLLLFLHHVKTQNGGMLGRVNLGLSGINVLWILD